MEAVLRKTITVPNVIFATIAQTWAVIKFLPDLFPTAVQNFKPQNQFVLTLFALLALNLVSFVLYRVHIYNRFFSPLRLFPTPMVCLSANRYRNFPDIL